MGRYLFWKSMDGFLPILQDRSLLSLHFEDFTGTVPYQQSGPANVGPSLAVVSSASEQQFWNFAGAGDLQTGKLLTFDGPGHAPAFFCLLPFWLLHLRTLQSFCAGYRDSTMPPCFPYIRITLGIINGSSDRKNIYLLKFAMPAFSGLKINPILRSIYKGLNLKLPY